MVKRAKPVPVYINPIEFKGKMFGIRLIPRGNDDKHVCFQFILEDDGFWYEMSKHSQPSTFWIADLQEVLKKVNVWMKKNCITDEYCGYRFK